MFSIATVYLTYRTTADIIWLFGEEEKPKHKVFRAQTLRKLLQETTAKNVLEILPFLVIEGMIEHLDMMREWLQLRREARRRTVRHADQPTTS